ncbi:MAG: hypothetical protein HY340_00520 [Candidatus Kerfeldbacteria bacterium]|nr:hypothetical protein [Candidatus Kerfeldbacteria bacterium]
MKRYVHTHAKGFQVVSLVIALAVAVGVLALVIPGAERVTAAVDATITGKVLGPTGSPISFECMPPPGSPPGQPQTCGIGVEAMAGPDTPPAFSGASTTDGSFSISVTGGKKYKIEFRGPPEALSGYSFPSIFVEIASGQTKDVGTVTATEKTGRINGLVRDASTLAPVADARVNAFPIFGGPEQGGEPKGPMMPTMATTGADGTFVLKVDPGRFGINLEQSPNSSYVYSGQPIEANCETATCNITGIIINAIKADATITGHIIDEAGSPVFFPGGVGARPVGATDFFDFNGPIMPEGQGAPGQPGTSGKYEIKVPSTSSQYILNIHTPPGISYSTKGEVTVTVVANGTVTKDLVVAKDSSSIFGKIVSESGFALSSCKSTGDKFQGGGFGEVFANNPKIGKFANAPINEDCTYKMTLGAGDYQFGYHLNPKAGYINKPAPPEPITVKENTDVEKNIVVIAGDATITGQVFDASGSPMGNVWIDAGNEGEARKDFQTGGQEGGAKGPGDGEFRGPGGAKTPEEMMQFCSKKENEKECKNFKLPPGATGPGGCTDMLACTQYCTKNPQICAEFDKKNHDTPKVFGKAKVFGQGMSLPKAASVGRLRALAEDVTKKPEGPDFLQNVIHMGTQAGPDGKFTLPVVSGHVYEVRAHLPPDKDTGSAIPPKAVTADLRTVKSANVVLQFRTSFGTMTGKVTLPNGSAADRCFVHYWSEAGDDGGSPCKQDGTFSLGYGQGKLHVSADSFDGRTPYRSDETIVTVTTQKTLTQNFKLKERGFNVPTPASKTFDASQQASVTLDDGTEISIPAGAMAESGNVTVSATPTVDLKSTENASPIGVGYTLTATDSNGTTISSFNSSVTITLPYDEDYVEDDLGLNESLLQTKYVNETTGAYESNENSSQDTSENEFTVVTDHFSEYTIVSPGGVNLKSVSVGSDGTKNTKIVIDSSITVKLPGKKDTWNVGTANFGNAGQYIVVSNMSDKANAKYRSKVTLLDTKGKIKKTITPFKGFKGGLNQVVEDITAKSGNAPDGTSDVVVAPATKGPAKAVIVDVKNNKTTTVTTGTGEGATSLNTAELVQAGIANLTTLFDGKTAKAWKVSKGKVIEAKGKVSSSLAIKNGKVEKKTATPKVKKVSGKCSPTSTSKLTITGSGFGITSEPVVLWNATSALAVSSASDGSFKVTINPSAVDVNSGVNTMTIVNSDGQAGVGIVTCKL